MNLTDNANTLNANLNDLIDAAIKDCLMTDRLNT
jgi:hypothetical protein